MERRRYVLAVMASGNPPQYSPAQLQKLFFLMDREVSALAGGPYFKFRPYDYGPFDAAVYEEVEKLSAQGLTVIDKTGFYRMYSLTPQGIAEGKTALNELPPQARSYAAEAAKWVRSLSFNEMVSAIYKKYPDMKENSVFRAA